MSSLPASPLPLGATDLPESASPRNLRGLWDEVDETELEVHDIEGRLPAGLVGTLFRNGPGSRRLTTTFFGGDGMIRALSFGADGRVRYKSRFVHTPKRLAERGADRPRVRTAGTQRPGGVLANLGRPPANEANTHAFWCRGELLALYEGGHPFRIHPHSLATLGTTDFGGTLKKWLTFSAHPLICPRSGDVYNFAPTFTGKPTVVGYKLDAQKRIIEVGRFHVGAFPMLHDAGLSERYQVFATPPMGGSMVPMLLGTKAVFDCLESRPELGSTIALLPRAGGTPIVIETDGFFVAHFVQCFDDGDDVVMDFSMSPDWAELKPELERYREDAWLSAAKQYTARFRVDTRTRRVRREVINDLPMDFPRIDSRTATMRHRVFYASVNPKPRMGGLYRALAAIDVQTGAAKVWDPGPDYVSQEPVFVPDPTRRGETGGWLLAYLHNAHEKKTEVVVLDAEHVDAGPLATLKLGIHAGMTFHGDWVPQVF